MPRASVDENKRLNLLLSHEAKAKLVRAAAISNTDLSEFVMQTALRGADAVIAATETIRLSERDHSKVLALLEDPPIPNAKLMAAAKALPKSI